MVYSMLITSFLKSDHAWEATDALKAYLGEHYVSTDENMFVSLWKNFRTCRVRFLKSPLTMDLKSLTTFSPLLKFVDESDEVIFYRDATGRRQKTVVMESVPSDSGVDVL